MPWYNYYGRRPWRRRWRRPRAPLRRRYWRRRWVRQKRKLPKLKLMQWQPYSIRKCKIKGTICLLQTTNQRLSNDFDLYELSDVPEHLPGGGGWGIKVYSLTALYAEHEMCRNVWTATNHNLPLCRYLGCSLEFYQSSHIDYCVTYSNQLPMESTLGLYNAMQPSIHLMQKNHITIPSKHTYRKRKPYIKVFIPPPRPLQNKWYFQHELAKVPLVMTRVSACSLDQYYIDQYDINTNMNITTLNTTLFYNRNFKNPGTGYSPKTVKQPGQQEGKQVWLYATRGIYNQGYLVQDLIPLTDTVNYTSGKSFQEIYGAQQTMWAANWKTEWSKHRGNPFHAEYIDGTTPVFQSFDAPTTIFTTMNYGSKVQLTEVEVTKTIRYNPLTDTGHTVIMYFLSNNKPETGWAAPDKEELTNEGLPFWLGLWGFADWHRKIKKYSHLDSEWMLVLQHQPNALQKEYLVPLGQSFLTGKSPYESKEPPLPADAKSWYPQVQYQNEIINDICRTGPGVAKLQDNFSAQALMKYRFYFKWGGDPAPMSTIADPRNQPTYYIPGNQHSTNSLQNPTTDPENILYSFDQRREHITPAAVKRLQKDKTFEKAFISGGGHFQEAPKYQQAETSEESSEEEETTTLFQQLQQQQRQHKLLKRQILKTMKKLQELE
nr:MAG: ORF1 [TTV-like mini virus]